ncbi:hypothetical protein [Thalassoglobus polymorphus]|uniref:Uncharacterized protein n=1 Tax=Thalassoglobus polymorphus TaxID=2527994 RepID=A0A517QUL1_9PLAN|nr:hypothetical protein [Thalassoglobus polymorphus]QDT35303.1 hypothetical protein Mal48_45790 [Thalassoglobus polymorphus]
MTDFSTSIQKWVLNLTCILIPGMLFPGCSKDAALPQILPELHDETLEQLSFKIDGRDPAEEEIILTGGKEYLVSASYLKVTTEARKWSTISMLLLESDPDTGDPLIRKSKLLGLPDDENRISKGKREWESRKGNGLDGIYCRFPEKPGRYEVRLCWMHNPETVDEKISQSNSPLKFATPFYRAELTIK